MGDLTTVAGEQLWWCNTCGARKPDPEPGLACPAGCGSRVTSSRPPATITAALAILEHAGWTINTGAEMRNDMPTVVFSAPPGEPVSPSFEELAAAGYVRGWRTSARSPLTEGKPAW